MSESHIILYVEEVRKVHLLVVMLIGTSYFHMCCVLWAVEDEC